MQSHGTPDVPRLNRPDRAEFRAHLKRGRPVVITGVMDSWPAMERWSIEFFAEKLGEERVPVGILPLVEEGKNSAGYFPWLHMSRDQLMIK